MGTRVDRDYTAAEAYGEAIFAVRPHQPDIDYWVFCTKSEPPVEISHLVAERKNQLAEMKKPRQLVQPRPSRARTGLALAAAATI